MEKMKCCLCGSVIEDFGNNPYPMSMKENDRCCANCDNLYVIPSRIMLNNFEEEEKKKFRKMVIAERMYFVEHSGGCEFGKALIQKKMDILAGMQSANA